MDLDPLVSALRWLVLGVGVALVWRRRRVSQSLRRLVRWGVRVGTEVLANVPTPQRPR